MTSDAEIVEYSEGVCSDGAAILRDGRQVSIPWIISALESSERHKSEVTRLSARVEELEREKKLGQEVIYNACRVVDADTYKHPMLSRQDAIDAGVMGLHEAVVKWRSAQPASSLLTPSKNKE